MNQTLNENLALNSKLKDLSEKYNENILKNEVESQIKEITNENDKNINTLKKRYRDEMQSIQETNLQLESTITNMTCKYSKLTDDLGNVKNQYLI